MHLYLNEKVEHIIKSYKTIANCSCSSSENNIETIMPGYTHLQRAQPISFAHHILAYFWMLERDVNRYEDSLKRINISPLGAGALAGTTFPIDREYSAELLDLMESMKIV